MHPEQRIVGPETVQMLELGHPWIISDSHTKRWPQTKPGQVVSLIDNKGRFLATALADPQDRIVARVLSRELIKLDHSWMKKRLAAALDLRQQHVELGDTNACRLVNAEGDGMPGLTVDRYADYLMVQLYCGGWRPHLPLVTQALQELLSPRGIYEKTRPQKTRELEASGESKRYGRLLTGIAAPERLEVRENGLNFLVSMEQGLNTGLFLDQRINRRELMTRVQEKRVLNLFSYTGAFSVAAAASGAQQVTSVDASPGYTEWAQNNFGINRLNPKRHVFIVGDCLSVLADLALQGKRYDIILMDPPSFSTTAKSRFTTRGGTSDLVTAALPLLQNNGLLITSSNHQKLDLADYLKELRRASIKTGSELRVVFISGQPEDFPYPVTFPEGRYLKYVVSVKGAP
ncbi:MAG: SAM-dependent methyltransferase [Geobacteraceae bacterium GWB2_52_12]|nr:MAG: SAM-dependent methyltransferase [Geobacteraceae bacterium GWB2_52_12]